jgi:hypothetical protein
VLSNRGGMRDLRRLLGCVITLALLASTVLPATADLVGPGRAAPELATGAWINSDPLTMQTLRGRVVLVEFWTYG